MNEVMLNPSLSKSLSFSQNELDQISTESDILKKDTESLTVKPDGFNYKMNIKPNNDTDLLSEDSVLSNSHDICGKLIDNRTEPVLNSVFSDSSSGEFEIVSVNVKNTTVTNTTYNLISQQSSVGNAEKNEFTPSSIQKLCSSADKSRVVVQVLTSNAENSDESQIVVEDKNITAQSSNISTFRDDVFKILSKKKPTSQMTIENKDDCSQSSNIYSFRNDVFNILSKTNPACDSTEAQKLENAVNNKNMKITSEYKSSNHAVRSRRKKNLKFFLKNGKGTKLNEIEYVASNLKNAPSRLLRIFHYVLFDTYGPCNSGLQVSKTRRSILLFCGYPFKRDSESYLKKKNCLQRLPFPILREMHQAVIGNGCSNRSEMVTQLMNFFMKPKANYCVEDEAEMVKEEKSEKVLSTHDYLYLKAIALTEPLPTVEVKRLSNEDIEKLLKQPKLDSGLESNGTDSSENSSYSLPAYILKGPGMKLKSFPKIAKKVYKTKSRMIEILHYILYGRIESTETCKRNILEFSGFLPCQKEFIYERQAMLNNMDHFELFQLCNILCLRGKTNTRALRIQKILAYLSNPTEPKKSKNFKGNVKRVPPIVTPELVHEKPCYPRKKENINGSEIQNLKNGYPGKKGIINGSELQNLKNGYAQKKENGDRPKLRDFRNICSNVECASPSDLTELNDLLFIKPCDESEIHQKILDFTPFDFSPNSMEYHFRKTLLHYMSFCIIKKIAQLLDIEDWEKCNNQADLSFSILTFLTEMKPSESHPRKVAPSSISTLDDILTKNIKSKKLWEKPKKRIFQIIEKKTEESWCFKKGRPNTKQIPESSLNHQFSRGKSIISPHKNQAVSKKSVFIQRLTKASLHENEVPQNAMDCLPNIISRNDDDATPLRALLHHPSDLELQQTITNIIKSDLWSSTIGELVQKVYKCYPDFNLSYRENFIKKEARQVISELRSNAVDTINSMQCKLSDVI